MAGRSCSEAAARRSRSWPRSCGRTAPMSTRSLARLVAACLARCWDFFDRLGWLGLGGRDGGYIMVPDGVGDLDFLGGGRGVGFDGDGVVPLGGQIDFRRSGARLGDRCSLASPERCSGLGLTCSGSLTMANSVSSVGWGGAAGQGAEAAVATAIWSGAGSAGAATFDDGIRGERERRSAPGSDRRVRRNAWLPRDIPLRSRRSAKCGSRRRLRRSARRACAERPGAGSGADRWAPAAGPPCSGPRALAGML